ncbi:hypothetical protein RHSIM_Rhsim02G0103200 [Rhododendron simsii]|uniref:Uncharacterized protein n=1 Tax=Rhododendron simsii TaxID=118357 RepID=A0A834HC59_RHOSS|nr:hypothetical protein RHSIM_RhsimUnG0028800 [Rhododendron simsii]KAF7116519.1 hypothetical protein RHSIM_RhsimUnG0025500 [Rhododendron simsii]KAF7151298.1 hypothetical protein RHSIM_Rhsim02G0103200 [Rhododendron simsii]
MRSKADDPLSHYWKYRRDRMKEDSTRTMENQRKSDVGHEDICTLDEMPTACHNKDVEKPGKRSKGKKRSTISVLKQDIDEGRLEIKKRRRNTSMQEPSPTVIVEKESTKETSHQNPKPSERIVEPYSTSKGFGNMWKLILMDEQGTRIQAVLFNDVINQFEQTFLKENSYIISDGLVKPVNAQYANVHKEVEVMLTNNKRLENAKVEITLNSIRYEFTSFEDLQHAGKNAIVGEELDRISKERPPIAVSRAKVTTYSGLLSLSTLSITTHQIKPALSTQEHMKEWFSFGAKEEDPEEILLQKKIKSAEKVTIRGMIERPSNDFQAK